MCIVTKFKLKVFPLKYLVYRFTLNTLLYIMYYIIMSSYEYDPKSNKHEISVPSLVARVGFKRRRVRFSLFALYRTRDLRAY